MSIIDFDNYRDFMLSITIYTLICMLVGNTTITWDTVIINFVLLCIVVLIKLYINKRNNRKNYVG